VRNHIFVALGSVLVLLGACTASAQIEKAESPTRSVPEPARLPDGKPNWTGFWVVPSGFLEVYRGPGGLSGLARDGVPVNVRVPQVRPGVPEMKSPYKEQFEALIEAAAVDAPPDSVAACLPSGMPRLMVAVYGMEILQTPKIIAITAEFGPESRRIWMNEQHPPADELEETYYGHSVGHWDGDVLVVETVGIRTDVPLDWFWLPHSKSLKITERFRQTAPGTLINEMTFDDPEAYVRPWTETSTYVFRADLGLKEFVCLENNRNVDESGLTTFK
jgi:hypothetical protein